MCKKQKLTSIDKAFKRLQHLQRHILCHTGERPFVCKFANCGKSFSRADNLLVHQKRHSAPYSVPQTSHSYMMQPLGAKMEMQNVKEPGFQQLNVPQQSMNMPMYHHDAYRHMSQQGAAVEQRKLYNSDPAYYSYV